MRTPGLVRRLARSERVRLSLTDVGGGLPLPLPSRRTWIAGLAVGLACLVVASIAWQQIASMRHPRGEAVSDLVMVLRGAWVLGLAAGALLLLLLAIALLSYRESARLADNQLIHVIRLGPLRAITEYDLLQVRNLRAMSAGEGARIRFDYAQREQGFGDEMPLAEAEKRVKMIQAAIDGVGRRPSQSGVAPSRPTPRP